MFEELYAVFMWQLPFILAVMSFAPCWQPYTAWHQAAVGAAQLCKHACGHQHHRTHQHVCCTGQQQQGHGPSASSATLVLLRWCMIILLSFLWISSLFSYFCIYSLFFCLLILFCAAALHSLNLTLCCTLSLSLFCSVLFYFIAIHTNI